MLKKMIIVAVCMGLFGCTSARISRSLSSGAIGCPAKQIKITEETASASGTHEWIAECNGVKYVCNYVHGSTTNCTKMQESVKDSK